MIILLKGPPGVGKTTAAEYISKKWDIPHLEFKQKLVEICKKTLILSDKDWEALYTPENKDVPRISLAGKNVSLRGYLIHMAENVLKPVLGKDIFARATINEYREKGKNAIISDLGFDEEYDILKDEKHITISINRNDHDYSNDSRKDVNTYMAYEIHYIRNDGTIKEFYSKLDEAIKYVL